MVVFGAVISVVELSVGCDVGHSIMAPPLSASLTTVCSSVRIAPICGGLRLGFGGGGRSWI